MGNQRKKIGLLCLLLIVGGGWITLASRQTETVEGQKTEGRALGTESGPAGPAALAPPSSTLPGPSSYLRDPNRVSPAGAGFGNGELFLKMMFSVALVIGLGAAALYASKKVLPRVAHASGKEIHVLETAYLGPRKALHIVAVGGRRLLLASTNDSITMLAPVDEAWREPQEEVGSQKLQVGGLQT